MALTAQRLSEGEVVRNVVLFSVLVYELVGPALTKRALIAAGEIKVEGKTEHFAHPHNVGVMEDADGVGEVGNAKCGDIMRMYLKISEDEIITDVKFQTFGCASAIATSSIATDMIKGKPLSEALTLTNQAVVEALDGLPAVPDRDPPYSPACGTRRDSSAAASALPPAPAGECSPAVKVHCSVLAEQAVKAAVADYYKRKGLPYDHPCDACGEGGCCGHDHAG